MNFDVIIIGSGPGGYVAAIRCAQLGMKTAIIEKYEALGGTCLNVGCIPSKALLDSSEHYHNATKHFKTHGIDLKGISPNMEQMIARKESVVAQNVEGIRYLMKKNKITVVNGHASFKSNETVEVKEDKGKPSQYSAKRFIIATGSKPGTIPGVSIDKKRILSSTEILNLKEIPKHLMVIGGGVIGLELGSVFARLGAKVSVLEFTNRIIGSMDLALAKELQKILGKLDFEFFLSHKVKSAKVSAKEVSVEAEDHEGKIKKFKGDYCLLSVGRRPYTDGLGLENTAVKLDDKGKIIIDAEMRTDEPNIYAIGDVVHGAMLAHKAEEEGMFVAEQMAGQKPHIKYHLIPEVVYTWPEVAAVGFTEEELKSAGIEFKSGIFPFKASGRARASMDTDGFIKVLALKSNDKIAGVHMIGPRAADMIAEAVVAMEFNATADEIARMSHAHPTYTEAFREACLAATDNRAIHM